MKKNKKQFYLGVLVAHLALFLALLPLLAVEKGEVVLQINQCRKPFWDTFFMYYTEMGNGVWIVITAVIFLFISYYDALIILLSGILHGILVWSGKLMFFSNSDRPASLLKGNPDLVLIEGFNHHMHHSFPSGHTASAFSLAVILMLVTRRIELSFILFAMAIAVGFSRMYLIQHFFVDVYAGAVIGAFSSIVVWHYMEHIRVREKPWMDKHIRLFPKAD